MCRCVLAAAALVAACAIGAPENSAAAMTLAKPSAFGRPLANGGLAQRVEFICDFWGCARPWAARHYWQWGWRSPPERPWERQWDRYAASPLGYFWGTPQPRLVPADVWARKWHPPGVSHWDGQHRVWPPAR